MSTTTTRLREREPQVIARDTAYVITALADDAITNLTKVSERLEQLRDEAPTKAKELRESGPQRLRTLPENAHTTIEQRREQVESKLDERLARLESSFDAKAAEGADRVDTIRHDERVTRVTDAFQPVGRQVKIARSQVKGAVTSVRKTVDAAMTAGRDQATTARSQVKAAATSTRKTVDTVVEAGRSLAS